MTDVNFDIVIGEVEDFVTLSENSLTPPALTEGSVDIKVKRTLKTGVWSTICLPFEMSEAQLKSAFGDGVQLAEFYDYSVTKEDGNVTAISVEFVEPEEKVMYANYPYLVKASKDVTEFMINAAIDDIDLSDAESSSKKAKKPIGKFVGTYVAQTTVPENSLFLSGNKFYYSTGATKMKGFRGYFSFNDVLSLQRTASARINLSFIDEEGNETSISQTYLSPVSSGKVYSILGRYVGKNTNLEQLPKGAYVVNGKKIIVK